MLGDCVLEQCTCYFWERRLTSACVGAIVGVIVFFLTKEVPRLAEEVMIITSILAGAVGGVTYYVVSSESYCHIESLFGQNETRTHPYMGDV